MIILNQSISKMQNYVTWTLTALLSILKPKMFMKILQMMLKKDFIHQIMKLNAISLIDHCLLKKNKKVIGLMKDELGRKNMTELAALRSKTYSYLMDDDNSES